MIEIEIPSSGWSGLSLTDVKGRNLYFRWSYLDAIPEMLLNGLSGSLLKRSDLALVFDAEGWNWRLIVSDVVIYVIEEKDESILYEFDYTLPGFAKQVHAHFLSYVDEWANWECYEELTERELENNRQEILNQLKTLEAAIENYVAVK